MAQVKGKFIILAFNLMTLYPKAQEDANSYFNENIGKNVRELDLEGWYDTKHFNYIMELYAKNSKTGSMAIVTLGKNVYPTIKRTFGLPEHLKTPVDFLRYEAEGFMLNHKGTDVKPREFLKVSDSEIIVRAVAPGYNEKLYEGVFLGILNMIGVTTGKVENIGNSTFKITW